MISSSSLIQFNDPCTTPGPVSLTPSAQVNPPDYYYTDGSPALKFMMNQWTSSPPECIDLITFSCTNVGPRNDMCTEGSLEPYYGDYVFETLDYTSYPPGFYDFTITGTVGNVDA